MLVDLDTGRDAELVRRVLLGVDRLAGGDDADVGAGPVREERRDVGDRADVDRVGPEGLERLGAAGDVGPLDLDVEVVDEPGGLQRHLGGRVADPQHGAVGGGVGQGGRELQLGAGLVAAAGGQGHHATVASRAARIRGRVEPSS